MYVGFIGLGQMGRGMAARLIERGHRLTVWNRTRATADALAAHGAAVAEQPRELLDADIVLTMLADDAAVETVWIAGGLVRELPAAALHLNMASVSARLARHLAELHRDRGASYVAAPVFGRPPAARSGELDIIAAGAEDALPRCTPLFEALGRRTFCVGAEPHHANVVKIARNFLLGSIIESLGEAFALVGKSGVDRALFLDIITGTSMNAPAYRNYGRAMLDEPREPTFTLKLGLKDVELALVAARESGLAMPLAELLEREHRAAIEQGYGEREWAALGRFVAEKAASGK
jgi:3-hydroxyisobutyrate dehydrogenase-like beta-hydroxyacid dehydrogenase